MKKTLVAGLAVGMMVAGASSLVEASVLNFENPQTDGTYEIADGYGGFDWNNMRVIDGPSVHPVSGYTNGVVSGSQVAYNSWAGMAITSRGSDFTFNGAYLTGAWNDGLQITVEGYDDGSLVYSNTVTASAYAPTYFAFNYQNVDELRFSSFGGVDAGFPGGGTHFAMDNFTYNAVPVPATFLLLGSGLAGLVGSRISRRKR
ncbi:MAG: PEP-CTERM sorting domain-containing protein [Thermodesulfobacteriota bacterium]